MTTFSVETIGPRPAAAVRAQVPLDELRGVFDRGFHAVMRVVQAQGLTVTGPPFGFYPRMPTDTVEVAVGFPVAAAIEPDGDVAPFELPGGRVVTGVHVGPYETLASTYQALTEWAATQGHALAGQMWEEYLSDPAEEPDPAGWRTRIMWPLAG
jgi:effector-binding domain-containing protein